LASSADRKFREGRAMSSYPIKQIYMRVIIGKWKRRPVPLSAVRVSCVWMQSASHIQWISEYLECAVRNVNSIMNCKALSA
jgi:hypothetical protein